MKLEMLTPDIDRAGYRVEHGLFDFGVKLERSTKNLMIACAFALLAALVISAAVNRVDSHANL